MTDWVLATGGLVVEGDPFVGLAHVRDPASPPKVVKPTTRRGRYASGEVREPGPGSHTGLALCGLPLMADELWCSARWWLKHAVNHARNEGLCQCVALCGMCSYLSGRPTVEAAWEGP